MTAVVWLLAIAGAAVPPPPLAAALVLDGQLVLADIPTRSLRPFEMAGLTPEEADLSLDKSEIIVNARPQIAAGPSRLYRVEVSTGQVRQIDVPLAGDQRFPRFAGASNVVTFVAPPTAGPDSPSNRNKIEQLHLDSGRLEDVPTRAGACNYVPIRVSGADIAYLSTGCFIDFELRTRNLTSGKDRLLANVSGVRSEVAVSPNRSKLVYTNIEADGLHFYLSSHGRRPSRLAVVPYGGERTQPRFVCPRDVMFVNLGKLWALNTDDGTVKELLDYKASSSWVSNGLSPKARLSAP